MTLEEAKKFESPSELSIGYAARVAIMQLGSRKAAKSQRSVKTKFPFVRHAMADQPGWARRG
jgi:hypothetical protein